MNHKRKHMIKMIMGLATVILALNSFFPVLAGTIDESVTVNPVKDTDFFPKVMTPSTEVAHNDPFSYVNDNMGIYPANHTQNYTSTQTSDNIQNFDFRKINSEGIPTKNVLDTQVMDFQNGYHSYTDAYVKKIVLPTDDPNNFKVQLDVIGKSLNEKQPVDIALVLDKSSSMNLDISGRESRSPSRWELLKSAVKDFAEQLLNTSNKGMIRLGLASFGSDYPNNRTSDLFANIGTFSNGTAFTDNPTEYMDNSLIKNNPGEGSGTPTFMGLDAGYKTVRDTEYGARQEAQKVVIILTDGVPTFGPNSRSYKNGLDSNNVHMTHNNQGYDSYKMTSGWDGDGIEDPKNSQIIEENRDYISGKNSQFSDIIKYSIGFTTGSNALEILKALGPDGYYSAANKDDLIDALNRLKNRLSNSIQNGIVTDPMSQYVTYKGDPKLSALKVENGRQIEIEKEDKNFPTYASDVKVVSENNQVILNSLNFGGTDTEKDGIRLTYDIELKEEYRDGRFHPANNATYLLSPKNNGDNVDYFSVPSVRAPFKPKPLNNPVKYVSDSDEILVDSDTLTDIHEKYLYTLEGEFLEMPTFDESKELKDWKLTDNVPSGITFDDIASIKAYAWDGMSAGENLTDDFNYSIDKSLLTIKAKPGLLKDPKMYEQIHKVRFEIGARVTAESKVKRDEKDKVHIVNTAKQYGHYYDNTTFDDPSNDVVTTVAKNTENSLKVSKDVDKNLMENGNIDPADTTKSRLQSLNYTINSKNISTTSSMDNIRILDVLPFNKDNRQTAFNAEGTAHVLSARLVDVNGNIVKGTRIYYKDINQAETNTNLDPNSLPHNTEDLAAKGWLEYDGSDASVLENTSAILVDIDNIPANTTYALKITIEHRDNVGADLINNAIVNSIVNYKQITNNVETKIYGRKLSGYVWYDDNYDGLKNEAEAPVKGLPVKLYRTSLENINYKNHLVIENVKGEKFIDRKGNSLIRTDDKGFYEFENLPEGHYIAEFEINGHVQLKEYQVTKFMASASDSNSKNSKVEIKNNRITAQNPSKNSDWNDVGATLKNIDKNIRPKNGIQELPYNNLGLNRSAHLNIFKKNFWGRGLSNAKFVVYRGDLKEIPENGEKNVNFIGMYETDKTGNLNVDRNLFANSIRHDHKQEYTVFEIKAPDGYELLKEPVNFTVSKGDQEIHLSIRDAAESILPFTGGKSGVALLIALSLVVLGLIGIGGGLFYSHYKNRGEVV